MPAGAMRSDEARSNWRRLLEGALAGDTDTIIERYGQPVGALIPFASYIAVLESLEELRVARQAMPALEARRPDPATARSWREVLAELGVEFSDEWSLDSPVTAAGKESTAPSAAGPVRPGLRDTRKRSLGRTADGGRPTIQVSSGWLANCLKC